MTASFIIAFEGSHCIGSGDLREVALKAKAAMDRDPNGRFLIVEMETSRPVEIDFRGSAAEVQARLPHSPLAQNKTGAEQTTAPRGPGRPKLGVVAREITLLPQHWEWLAQQPGGASVAIRKLVEDARRASPDKERIRQSQESLHRFMTAIAGDYPQYEDALRALYAKDRQRFEATIADWPTDVREHVMRLASDAFESKSADHVA